MLFRDGTMQESIVLFPLQLLMKSLAGTIYFLILLILNIFQTIEDNVVSFSYAVYASIVISYSFSLSTAGFALN
ncbi:hypothetical protein BC629DRAFT_1451255 [Irpex lacteus]|nr:hypothetical protein BC629DRAFT_1451255 [Irpex lacteus]